MEKRSTRMGTGALIWRLRSKTFGVAFALLLLAAPGLASATSAEDKDFFVTSICAADPQNHTACTFNSPCTVVPDTCTFETTLPVCVLGTCNHHSCVTHSDCEPRQRVLCTCLELKQKPSQVGFSSAITDVPHWIFRVPKISGNYPGGPKDVPWTVTGETTFKLALKDTFEADCQWIDDQVQHCAPRCKARKPGGVCPPEPIAGSLNNLSTMKPWTIGFTYQPPTGEVAESTYVSFSSRPGAPETLRFRTRVPYPYVRDLNKEAFKFDIYAEKPQRVSPASSFVVHFTFTSSEDTSGKKTGTGAIKLASAFVNVDSSAQILRLENGIGQCIPTSAEPFCNQLEDCDCHGICSGQIPCVVSGGCTNAACCVAYVAAHTQLQLTGSAIRSIEDAFNRTYPCRPKPGTGLCKPEDDWALITPNDFCTQPRDCDCHGQCFSGPGCSVVCGDHTTCCQNYIEQNIPCRPLTTAVDALVQGTDVYIVYKQGPGPVSGDNRVFCLNHLPNPFEGPDQCQTATLLDPVFGVDLAELWSTPAAAPPVSRTRKLVDWLLKGMGWAP